MFSEGVGSYNDDVLSAEPTSVESKLKLVEEVKSRAKGCIGSRNFPEAVKLYSKAITTLTDDNAALAILHANRSMCYLNMNNHQSALEDAQCAERLDSSYVKAYYRQAMAFKAQGKYSDGIAALKKGLVLKPDDKEMSSQMTKFESEAAAQRQKALSAPAAATETSSIKARPAVPAARSTVQTGKGAATSSSYASKPSSAQTSSAHDDEDEDEDEAALANMRGYKKTSDGRVTTFFNNELDEEAKRLIGDIAPKKLDSGNNPAVVAAATGAVGGSASLGSAWNSAGTYEERILTPWLSQRLQDVLGAIDYQLSCAEGDIPPSAAAAYAGDGKGALRGARLRVTGVEGVAGDAQVSMIRGKKKHIADFCLDLQWQLSLLREGGGAAAEEEVEVVEGKLSVLDITADKEFEMGALEITRHRGQPCSTASLGALPGPTAQLVQLLVKGTSASVPMRLESILQQRLDQICDEFKTK